MFALVLAIAWLAWVQRPDGSVIWGRGVLLSGGGRAMGRSAPVRRRSCAMLAASALLAVAGPANGAASAQRAGALRQLAGAAGCWKDTAASACSRARRLASSEGVAVSPDGGNVYVASSEASAVLVFA